MANDLSFIHVVKRRNATRTPIVYNERSTSRRDFNISHRLTIPDRMKKQNMSNRIKSPLIKQIIKFDAVKNK